MTLSQWQRLAKNVGVWQGSFTRFSPTAELQSDLPSQVTLTLTDADRQMEQTVKKGDSPPQVWSYRTLGRGVLFCENGAFSNGSLQWSPTGSFGAELGLITELGRLRVAIVYESVEGRSQLGYGVLIRETNAAQPGDWISRTWQPETLVGTWNGTAETLFPDYRPEQTAVTRLTLETSGADRLRQRLETDSGLVLESTGRISDRLVLFNEGAQPNQVMVLPGGASVTCPRHITPGQPFGLEVGWLIDENRRQRLIRRYDASGGWSSLTLVRESR